jgi:NAD(P)-dependent dehydrogenase (short-subunit alcohol dehydrogenase family)
VALRILNRGQLLFFQATPGCQGVLLSPLRGPTVSPVWYQMRRRTWTNGGHGAVNVAGERVGGFEKTFQVNYLAPFLLTWLLTGKLTASAAKVIQTSSVGARMARKFDIDDLDEIWPSAGIESAHERHHRCPLKNRQNARERQSATRLVSVGHAD